MSMVIKSFQKSEHVYRISYQALDDQPLLPEVALEDPPLGGGLRRRGHLVAAVPRQHEVDRTILVAATTGTAAVDIIAGPVLILEFIFL